MNEMTRFLKYVLPAESGCHEWQSTIHRDGYGKFYFRGKQEKAHRAAYELQVGPITDGLWVLHHCDNRKCVNPAHLYLGNAKQNVRDKVERCAWFGNMRVPFDGVQEAKRLYSQGWSQQMIAAQLSVSQSQVSRYVRGVQRAQR